MAVCSSWWNCAATITNGRKTPRGDLWLGFEPEECSTGQAALGFARIESQFLAQKNGFQIQIHGFRNIST